MITGELLSFLKKKKKIGFIDLCVYIGLLAEILKFLLVLVMLLLLSTLMV
jgi:LytS/YehU family sensor histidine kinase